MTCALAPVQAAAAAFIEAHFSTRHATKQIAAKHASKNDSDSQGLNLTRGRCKREESANMLSKSLRFMLVLALTGSVASSSVPALPQI